MEDAVHFFQGAVCGFWVEEVDGGKYESVAVEDSLATRLMGTMGKG